MLVAGTPAGSPSRPSNGTVDTAVSNNPYIDLADIRVNAGVTQITDADITDTRVLVGAPIADGSVTTAKVADGSVTSTKIDFGGAGSGIWWEEIGRTTRSGAGDTITVSGLPARKYIMIKFDLVDSGAINALIRLNNDSGANYSIRILDNGSGATAVSQTSVGAVSVSASLRLQGSFNMVNLAAHEKMLVGVVTNAGAAGAGTPPNNRQVWGKWANTSDAITSVSLVNGGAGDYATGSEVVVLGHD